MKRVKILIAEDEVVTAMDLWHLLDLWGYEMCEQVACGEEAVGRAEEERPDIVLIDINLKGKLNGIEAAGQIRSRFGIPVIFITGYSDNETREKAKVAGPVDYFVKPIDYYRLRSAIDSVFRKADES